MPDHIFAVSNGSRFLVKVHSDSMDTSSTLAALNAMSDEELLEQGYEIEQLPRQIELVGTDNVPPPYDPGI